MSLLVTRALSLAALGWGRGLRVTEADRFNKLICKASDVVGVKLDCLAVVLESGMLCKLRVITSNFCLWPA